MKLDKILVPLDGSMLAEGALATACDFAARDGATISLLRAAEAMALPGANTVEAQVTAVREAEEYLAAVVKRLADKGIKRVETHVWYGAAAASIVEAASVQKADLIVMCTHGRSGVGRLVLGSVAESVLRGTTAPILIVRADRAPLEVPRERGRPRGLPMYRRALVPLDGSMIAEAIVPFILEIAGPLDMEVALLRVVVPAPPLVIEGSTHAVVEDVQKLRSDAEEYLAPVAAALRARGVHVTTHVRVGDAVGEILAGARESEADLIAMTTHGRGGLGRLLFGSIAEAVLRQAEVPVFLMRQTKAQVAARAAWEAVR